MFNKAPHGKELSEDLIIRIVALHKDGLGYRSFSNNLKLSYSTVARASQASINEVKNLASKNRCMSVASIALEVAEAE
ncbi:hypothetical protein M9458_055054, partial [Cirrhinus mrigala]